MIVGSFQIDTIHYTFKLQAYEKLFYFDKLGFCSEPLANASIENGQRLNSKFKYVSTDIFYSGKFGPDVRFEHRASRTDPSGRIRSVRWSMEPLRFST